MSTDLTILAPMVLSKSAAKAVACETHFRDHYLRSELRRSMAPIAASGVAFHEYRAAYINHLVDIGVPMDAAWAKTWLAVQPCIEDARRIIDRDIEQFTVNPDQVMGVELFLSVDSSLLPIERINNFSRPGYRSEHPDATDSGTIDLLLVDGTTARIVDYKSGFATSGVGDHEPPRYAGLVFAHFPKVEVVEFVWEFTRLRATKQVRYERKDLPEIQKQMADLHVLVEDIRRRDAAGEELTVNSHAGLCPFCEVSCPLKKDIERVDIVPIQTVDEARKVAALTYVAGIIAARGRDALKSWIDHHGPVSLPNDWEARIDVQKRKKLPLREALGILGCEIAPLGTMERFDVEPKLLSPDYGVPLDKLNLSSSSVSPYAKAKKRAGLSEDLFAIANINPVSILKIARKGESAPNGDDDE